MNDNESDDADDSDDTYGAVAQLVAQRIVSAKVAGSSPVCSAKWGGGEAGYHTCLSRKRPRVRVPFTPPVFSPVAQ